MLFICRCHPGLEFAFDSQSLELSNRFSLYQLVFANATFFLVEFECAVGLFVTTDSL